MKLITIVRVLCFSVLFCATINAAKNAAKSDDMPEVVCASNAPDIFLPNFACASKTTSIILTSYTASDCQQLFRTKFPISDIASVLKVVSTISELKGFADCPDINSTVKAHIEEIANNLCKYLYDGIMQNKETLLSQIEANFETLTPEQQEELDIVLHKNRFLGYLREHTCECTTAFVIAGVCVGLAVQGNFGKICEFVDSAFRTFYHGHVH